MKNIIDAIKIRFKIIKLSIIFNFQLGKSSIFNTWGSIISVIGFQISYLIFIEVLFTTTNSLGVYTKNDMLFLLLCTQMQYYGTYFFTDKSSARFLDDIKSGNLDYALTKPIPSLFYISTRNLPILEILRDAIPSLMIVGYLINWSLIDFNILNIIIGIIMYFCGQYIINVYYFLLTIPSIWIGEAENIRGFRMLFDELNGIGYENHLDFVQKLFTIFIPIFVGGIYMASVLLNKTNSINALATSLVVTILAFLIHIFVWKKALNNYSSASS